MPDLFRFRRWRDRIWYALLPWECFWWRHPVRALRTGRPYDDPFFWQFWLWKREALQERKRADYWLEKHDEILHHGLKWPVDA